MLCLAFDSKIILDRAFTNQIIILSSHHQKITMNNIVLKISAVAIGIFGLVSLFMTGSIIFNLFGIRATEAHFIPFIVYTNFGCSLIYLLASYGFLIKNRMATISLFLVAAILIIAYIALIFYIYSGGVYETRTIKIMLFRVAVTLFFAGIAWYHITRVTLLNVPSA